MGCENYGSINVTNDMKFDYQKPLSNLMEKIKFKYVVAGVVLTAFLMIVYALTYRVIPAENRDIFIHTVGILEGLLTAIVGFYFGSSAGSAEKNEIIKQHMQNQKPQ